MENVNKKEKRNAEMKKGDNGDYVDADTGQTYQGRIVSVLRLRETILISVKLRNGAGIENIRIERAK